MDSTEDNGNDAPRLYARKSYALHGKIMLTVVLILFTVVILVVCLHIYARQYHRQARRRHRLRRRRRRRTQINIYSDTTASANTVHGLDASVLKSLPIFIYSSTAQDEVGECTVCLSEFEENEKGRLLPKCSHSFHIDCIDMWFHSHSTCPLCRAPVSREIPAPATETPVEVAVVGEVAEPEAETSSGVCPSGGNNEGKMGCSSASSSAFGVEHIEVPRRNESFRGLEEEEEEEETGLASPGGQGFKSPGGRIRSLKRMLTRDRKTPFPPLGCSPAAEIDLEKAEGAPSDDPSNVKR